MFFPENAKVGDKFSVSIWEYTDNGSWLTEERIGVITERKILVPCSSGWEYKTTLVLRFPNHYMQIKEVYE